MINACQWQFVSLAEKLNENFDTSSGGTDVNGETTYMENKNEPFGTRLFVRWFLVNSEKNFWSSE